MSRKWSWLHRSTQEEQGKAACTPPPTVNKLLSPPVVRSPGIKLTALQFFPFFFFCRIGVLCAYAANQNLSSQVKNIRRYVNSNMRDLHTFANDTPMVRVTFFQLCTSLQKGAKICGRCPTLILWVIPFLNILRSGTCRDLLLFISLLFSVVFHVCSKLIT